MLGPQTGMGPVWLQAGRFRRCDELHTEPCDTEATDQCCAIIPCTLCLIWRAYDAPDVGGMAAYDRDSNKWVGGVAEVSFEAYWERNVGTGECEFKVELDGDLVATIPCSGSVCRSPAGSAYAVVSSESGELFWEVYEKRSLPYKKTQDGCTDFFCGNCECTCKKLCVTVRATINDVSSFTMDGQDIIEGSTACDSPLWSGVVEVALSALTEDVEVEIYMYRDEDTGDCWMAGTVREQELTPQRMSSCRVEGTFTLYDGSVVIIRCFECTCESSNCEFCCLPLDFSNPLYPAGIYKSIPFAMECGAKSIEGDLTTSPANLPCTQDVVFYGPTWSTPSQTMFLEGVDAKGDCATTPCGNTFGFVFECTARFAEDGDDSRCDRLFLWIGSLNPLVGDDGSRPGGSLSGLQSWVKFRPVSCSCDDVGGVSAIFSFDITIDCSDKEFGNPYGPCAEELLSCCEYSCAGTVII